MPHSSSGDKMAVRDVSVAAFRAIPWQHRWQHRFRFRGISGIPDPHNHADLALRQGLKWARLDSNALLALDRLATDGDLARRTLLSRIDAGRSAGARD
jgi:hypothetical protein